MKSIEFITHAYAVDYPHFAPLLAYQLSSLVLYPPKCEVMFTVCHTRNDKAVRRVVRYFRRRTGLRVKSVVLSDREIGRRSIGRNVAAKDSEGDLVWFADADYFFGEECLDSLSRVEWPDDVVLIYPRHSRISRNHAVGDNTINQMRRVKILDIDRRDFVRQFNEKAIGGIQIVQGDFAREHGYLDSWKLWQTPTDAPFRDTRDDVVYRERVCENEGKVFEIRLPNLFRIRHTTSALDRHWVQPDTP